MRRDKRTESKDFFNLVCRLADVKNTANVVKWWNMFKEAVIRKLYLEHYVTLPGLGYFTVRVVDESVSIQKDKNGDVVEYVIPSRIVPVFVVDDDFINDVNMMGVTKTYRKRIKTDTLSKRDYERMLRAEKMKELEQGVTINPALKEDMKKKFEEIIKQKKEGKK